MKPVKAADSRRRREVEDLAFTGFIAQLTIQMSADDIVTSHACIPTYVLIDTAYFCH